MGTARFAHALASVMSTSILANVSAPSRTASRVLRIAVRQHTGLPTVHFLIRNVSNKMDNVGDGLGVKNLYALSRTCRRQPHHANAAAPTRLTISMGSSEGAQLFATLAIYVD